MTAVLLGGPLHLVADVISGSQQESDHVWVCVRTEDRAAGKGWLGCWSSKEAAPGEADVRMFLSALNEFIVDKATMGPVGPGLTDHYFHEGWHTWGPGTPGPLNRTAATQPSSDEVPCRIEDFRINEVE